MDAEVTFITFDVKKNITHVAEIFLKNGSLIILKSVTGIIETIMTETSMFKVEGKSKIFNLNDFFKLSK